jgi:hypothetical protein
VRRFSARTRTALATCFVAAAVVGTALPAQAALPNSDWTEFQPASDYLPVSGAVSCVAGSQFCVAITTDSADVQNGLIGPVDLVTTDSGKTWTAYNDLFPAVMEVQHLSCATTKVCVGFDQAKLVETTDGGVTWREWEPSAWTAADGVPILNAIDCVSAASCWLAGVTPVSGGGEPYLAQLRNGSVFPVASLSRLGRDGTSRAYELNGISCPSASSCTAVGTMVTKEANGGRSQSAISVTTGGSGVGWRLTTMFGDGYATGVSCVGQGYNWITGPASTCFAVGGASGSPVITVSHDNGQTWTSALTDPGAGWTLGSISCADASHCWATTGSFTDVVLLGSADGGSSWTQVTSGSPDNEISSQVSYLNTSTFVASADARIFVTTDDGGLAG